MNSRQANIIIRPLVTEKSTASAQMNKYTFEVPCDANKVEIAQALEALIAELYPKNKTTIVKVNTSAIRGRIRRSRRHGRAPRDSKKAIVTTSGDPLEFFGA